MGMGPTQARGLHVTGYPCFTVYKNASIYALKHTASWDYWLLLSSQWKPEKIFSIFKPFSITYSCIQYFFLFLIVSLGKHPLFGHKVQTSVFKTTYFVLAKEPLKMFSSLDCHPNCVGISILQLRQALGLLSFQQFLSFWQNICVSLNVFDIGEDERNALYLCFPSVHSHLPTLYICKLLLLIPLILIMSYITKTKTA